MSDIRNHTKPTKVKDVVGLSPPAQSLRHHSTCVVCKNEKTHGGSLRGSLDTAAMLTVRWGIVRERTTNRQWNQQYCFLNETPVLRSFATFKAVQVEKKFKPVTRSKISILFRTLGCSFIFWYTIQRQSCCQKSLQFKSFFFSFFLETHSSATCVRPPLSFLFFFVFFGTNYVQHLC